MLIQLPAIFLMISLISSVIICAVSNRKIASFLYQILAIFAVCTALIILLSLTSKNPSFIYSFGGWKKGIGIDISVDYLSAFFLTMASVVFFITSEGIVKCVKIKTNLFGFCALVFTGLIGLILTVDWFSFYVFLELTSISLYVILTADYGDGKSYSSAFNYLVIGSVANIFILLGIFFIYSSTGTLNMAITSNIIQSKTLSQEAIILMQTSYILIISGLVAKSALYPLHSWIMRCYINIPSVITAFIAAIVTKIAMLNIYKISTVFGYIFIDTKLSYFIIMICILCYLSIILCSFGALFSKDLKTILSFSSMTQSGYMLLGIFSFNSNIISGVFLQMLAHSLAIAVLFMIVGVIEKRFNYSVVTNTNNLQYCLQNETLLKFAFVVSLFSVIGFPMTLGFIAKWYMLTGFYMSAKYLSFIVVIIGSGIGMLYSWRLVEYLFFQDAIVKNGESCEISFIKTPKTIKFVLFLVIVLIVLFSIFNANVMKVVDLALH